MTKTLTEQWKDGELPNDTYYVKDWDGTIHRFMAQNKILWRDLNNPIYASERIEVLEPVPNYDVYLYLKTNNDHWNKEAIRISKQAIGIVLESDELVQKIHILNEQNTKQYNELCEEIKKNNILEKKLEIATKAFNKVYHDMKCWTFVSKRDTRVLSVICEAIKEMKGVK